MGKKNKSDSLCWTCSLAGHGLCSWDLDGVFEPNSYVIKHHSYLGDNYTILECPKYTTEPIQYPLRNVKALCNAIITAACQDYRNARESYRITGKPEHKLRIEEIEQFFCSKWANDLTNLDPLVILETLKKEIEKEIENAPTSAATENQRKSD